jgi:hypothetical protein
VVALRPAALGGVQLVTGDELVLLAFAAVLVIFGVVLVFGLP